MAKLLTFIPKTKEKINEKIELMGEIKQIQAIFCNTITSVDVEYTIKKLKERKKEL